MSREEFASEGVGDSDANVPSAKTRVVADYDKGGTKMPVESSKVIKYQACPECARNQITKVLFHSHVSQFDQLVKMITVIGEHFETHTNVAVVVMGDSSNVEKGQTKLEKMKSEDGGCDAFTEEYVDLNGNSDRHEDDPDVEMNRNWYPSLFE